MAWLHTVIRRLMYGVTLPAISGANHQAVSFCEP